MLLVEALPRALVPAVVAFALVYGVASRTRPGLRSPRRAGTAFVLVWIGTSVAYAVGAPSPVCGAPLVVALVVALALTPPAAGGPGDPVR
ncbi:MAG: hypothetical protein CL433_13180 [Acidimicrobiaceae bacterium]|nr:hypothetical protein [Acidimicrobiaceae bacterium]